MKIGSPVDCTYQGGNTTLGRRGSNLWIEDGKIGHGAFRMKYAIALSTVASVDVTERLTGEVSVRVQPLPGTGADRRAPVPVTDITVRTRDGEVARWLVRGRGAEWVRRRLAPVLQESLIPFYDDLPPGDRSDRA